MAELENTQGGNNTIEDTGDGRITGQQQQIIDTVNEAIEKGDIEVGGGTKLYKHTILLTLEETNDTQLIVISNNPNSYGTNETLNNIYSALTLDFLNGNAIAKQVMGLEAFSLEMSEGNLTLYIIMLGAISPITFSSTNNPSVSDTVTEL